MKTFKANLSPWNRIVTRLAQAVTNRLRIRGDVEVTVEFNTEDSRDATITVDVPAFSTPPGKVGRKTKLDTLVEKVVDDVISDIDLDEMVNESLLEENDQS